MQTLSRRNSLFLLILSHMAVDAYSSFLAPLQPFLISRHALSLTKAGLLVSLYSVSASLLQPVYGYWADRLGKKIFIVIGPLMAALFMTLIPAAPTYGMVMLLLFLGGVGVASFHPQASSLSHFLSGSRKGLGMSLFISGGNLGTAIGPVFIMFLVNRFGMDSTYFGAVPGILLCLVLVFFCPELEKKNSVTSFSSLIGEVKDFARPLGFLYGIVVFRTFVHLGFLTYTPILLKQLNPSPMLIGVAATAYLASGAMGGMIGGFLYDRIGGRNLFVFSTLLSPVFYTLTAYTQNHVLVILFFALSGFVLMMTVPVSVLMGQTIVPNAISTVSSLMMGFGWGMGGLLVPVVGTFADMTSIPQALRLLALVPFLYLPLVWHLPKLERQKVTQPERSYPVLEA